MSREDVQKLLGGYATGTLTAEEQEALFTAALEDQEIFDALVREQGLRDLLRDPSARAEVLAALDERPARGVRAWVRSPWVAGLAMAGLAAIGIAVWQISPRPSSKRVIVAENRPAPAPPQASTPPPVARDIESAPPSTDIGTRRETARRAFAPPPAPPRNAKEPVEITAAAPEIAPSKPKPVDQLSLNQQAPAAAAPPAPQFQNQAIQLQAPAGDQVKQTADARALFYGPSPPSARSAFAPSQADQQAVRKKAAEATRGALGGVVGGVITVAPLGVRASVVQGGREMDLATALQSGDVVRLKLIPNADGFLYVTEDGKVIASSTVQRLVAFETPDLTRDTPGQRQFQVTLTRSPLEIEALGRLGKDTRANIVETKAETEAATYAVQNTAMPAPRPVVVPVTLTWK